MVTGIYKELISIKQSDGFKDPSKQWRYVVYRITDGHKCMQNLPTCWKNLVVVGKSFQGPEDQSCGRLPVVISQ